MESISELKSVIRCRDAQIDTFAGLISKPSMPLPPSIFIHGDSGSGKSTVIEAVLDRLGVNACTINCIETSSPQLIFQATVDKLSNHSRSASNMYCSHAPCDGVSEFVRQLQLLATPGDRMAMVLYESQRLRDSDPHLLPALSRLQELCEGLVNISVILVSSLPLDKMLPPTSMAMPLSLHFPQYSRDELHSLLLTDRDGLDGYSQDFHSTYITLVLSVFYPATRNITEMHHLLSTHWIAYSSPVSKGEIEASDLRSLWRNIEPHLRKALETVYLREITSTQYQQMERLSEQSGHALPNTQTLSSAASKVELPCYSKYLLIAAYLASYNPAKSDKRFFMKHHGKQKKTIAMMKSKEKSCSQLTGPKQFPLDRLMAIFYSIADYKVIPTAAVFSQLSSLVTLRLLVQCGGNETLDAPKYKCAVNLDFIRAIARTVDFDIVHYLYDF